jgi:hypothetical protein
MQTDVTFIPNGKEYRIPQEIQSELFKRILLTIEYKSPYNH